MQYFLEHGQHNPSVQSVAFLVNIRLPFQGKPTPATAPETSAARPSINSNSGPLAKYGYVAMIPYVRRLIVTSFDKPAILHGFFGDDWSEGIGPIHEMERRNYLFAAKSDTWLRVKEHYDMDDGQTVPFLQPLEAVYESEIQGAESNWSAWLAMQDWMLGPRAPPGVPRARGQLKTEDD